jgi:midasin (ATPase involved in ribosome maturation)
MQSQSALSSIEVNTILKDDTSWKEIESSGFFIDRVKFMYLKHSILRGNNIMMVGPAGCGKTQAVYHAAKVLGRKLFTFNLGSTQDPRITLLGNKELSSDKGTYFAESLFITAIQTPDAVILLDEFSRANQEAGNILMPVLDNKQRYLRIEEVGGSKEIRVASGVTFIATANIGNEYTGTRKLDRAMKDRFAIIEMQPPTETIESKILVSAHGIPEKAANVLASISFAIRNLHYSDAQELSTFISTRSLLRCAELYADGFSIGEIAEVAIYPMFEDAGGNESERGLVRKIVEKHNLNDRLKFHTEPDKLDDVVDKLEDYWDEQDVVTTFAASATTSAV